MVNTSVSNKGIDHFYLYKKKEFLKMKNIHIIIIFSQKTMKNQKKDVKLA